MNEPSSIPDSPARGTVDDFDMFYTRVAAPSDEQYWTRDQVRLINPDRVWTVVEGDSSTVLISAGVHWVNRVGGFCHIVTVEPAADPDAEFTIVSADEAMEILYDRAADAGADAEDRAAEAREAYVNAASAWSGWAALNDQQKTELDDAIDDDVAALAAVDAVCPLPTDRRKNFGALLAGKLWEQLHPAG